MLTIYSKPFLLLLFSNFVFLTFHGRTTNDSDFDFVSFMNKNRTSIDSIKFVQGGTTDSLLLQAITRYNIFVFEHKKDAYKWQLLSSKIIFFVVVFIVLTGLFLSYLQFKTSMLELHEKRRPKKLNQVKVADVEQTEAHPQKQNITETQLQTTTIEIGKEGLKMSSAVIGLIILMASLAFFFLYLNYAFNINE